MQHAIDLSQNTSIEGGEFTYDDIAKEVESRVSVKEWLQQKGIRLEQCDETVIQNVAIAEVDFGQGSLIKVIAEKDGHGDFVFHSDDIMAAVKTITQGSRPARTEIARGCRALAKRASLGAHPPWATESDFLAVQPALNKVQMRRWNDNMEAAWGRFGTSTTFQCDVYPHREAFDVELTYAWSLLEFVLLVAMY